MCMCCWRHQHNAYVGLKFEKEAGIMHIYLITKDARVLITWHSSHSPNTKLEFIVGVVFHYSEPDLWISLHSEFQTSHEEVKPCLSKINKTEVEFLRMVFKPQKRIASSHKATMEKTDYRGEPCLFHQLLNLLTPEDWGHVCYGLVCSHILETGFDF